MDIVYIIITVMLVCATACALLLVWPVREPKDRHAADATLGTGAQPADDSDGSTGHGTKGG